MFRETTKADFELFWPTFSAVIRAQETYAFDPEMTLEEAYHIWCEVVRLCRKRRSFRHLLPET